MAMSVGGAVDELRGGRAKFVRAGKKLVGSDFPRMRFAGKPAVPASNAGFISGDM
jgi:hypothetical protein